MTRNEILDLVGCGCEIADAAARDGVIPVAIRDNGLAGDKKCVIYDYDGIEVIDTNGGAVWGSDYGAVEWEDCVSDLIDGRVDR